MPRRGENIYKRKDGRWEGRYRIQGEAKYRSVYGKSYQEVRIKLLTQKSKRVHYTSSGCRTVGYLFSEWLATVKIRVKESTYLNYCMKVNKHILPAFGEMRYEHLSVRSIHSFIEQKLSEGLSAKYVSDIIVVFKSMCKYISRVHGFRNPLADVILPKQQHSRIHVPDEYQQKQLCRYLLANMNTTSVCILLSLYTGLRIGEVCGLKWEDIDFEKSRLTVRRTVQRISLSTKGTKLIVGSPKSKTSCRIIPLPSFLTELLIEYRQEDESYILSGSTQVIEPRTLQHRFSVILKKAGLPSFNYHMLRHIFATNCISLGFDVKTLSEILGHASVETTLNRYVHSSMERKAECMNKLTPAA